MATAKQADPVYVNALPMQNTSWSGPQVASAHVHKPPPQVLKPGDLLALRKVQQKDICEQTPIDEARHSVTLFWLL